MSNSITITTCQECLNWSPADSYGLGVFCDELRQVVYDPKDDVDEDGCNPIPDSCPLLEEEVKIFGKTLEEIKEEINGTDIVELGKI